MTKTKPNLAYETVLVTPTMADEWLALYNNDNRPLSDSTVDDYMREMKAGEWTADGQAITFDWNGHMLNGQHRCWAASLGKVSFWTTVVRGVDPKAFKNYDGHKRRNASDVIGIGPGAPTTHRRPIATAAFLCMKYNAKNKYLKANARQVSDWYDEHPDLETWAVAAGKGAMRPFASPLAAVTYLACGKYRARAVDFVTKMVDGDNLPKGSPILAVRTRLLAGGPVSGTGKREGTHERFGLLIHAWNAYIEGRPMQRVQTSRTDDIKFTHIAGASR